MKLAKEVPVKGLTIKVIIIGLFLAFVISQQHTFDTLSPTIHGRQCEIQSHYNIGNRDTMYSRSASWTWSALGLSVVFLLLTSLVNRIRPNTFSAAEIAILMVVLPWAPLMVGAQCSSPWLWVPQGARGLLGIFHNYKANPQVADLIMANFPLPSFTKADIWQTYANPYCPFGFVLANFGGMISWQIVWMLMGSLTLLFLAMLIRPLFIDIEDMPIFFSELQVGMVESTQGEGFKWNGHGFGSKAMKFFAIGFLIQFAYQILGHGYDMFYPWMQGNPLAHTGTDWGENYAGWLWGMRKQVQICADVDYTALAILPWVPLHARLKPYEIAWGYLLPMDILVGWFIGHFAVNFFFPLIATSAGLLPPFAKGDRDRSIPPQLAGYGSLSGLLPMMNVGIVAALALYPIWRARHQMAPVFKALWKKVDPEFEAKSPLPYRWIWIGLIGSFIIWMILALPCGGPFPVSLFAGETLINMILYIGLGRMLLESGGTYFAMSLGEDGDPNRVTGILASLWYNWGTSTTGKASLTNQNYWLQHLVYAANSSGGHEGGVFWTVMVMFWFALASFKTVQTLGGSKEGKANLKGDWFKAILTALVVVVVGATLWQWYWFGVMPIKPGWETYSYMVDHPQTRYTEPLAAGTWPTPSYMTGITTYLWRNVGVGVLGFALTVAIYIARARLPWLAIAPTGLALGTIWGMPYVFTFPIALALKWITMRIGGVEFYRQKARPLCLGFIAGFVVAFFFLQWLSITNAIRFGFAFAEKGG